MFTRMKRAREKLLPDALEHMFSDESTTPKGILLFTGTGRIKVLPLSRGVVYYKLVL